MQVIWSAEHEYRGFFAPGLGKASLVSSHLVEEAQGRVLDNILTVVVDARGLFCDFELDLAGDERANERHLPEMPEQITSDVRLTLEEDVRVQYFLDASTGVLFTKLLPGAVDRWFQVGESPLYLGVDDRQRLSELVFKDMKEDEAGLLESAWLDQIEQLRP